MKQGTRKHRLLDYGGYSIIENCGLQELSHLGLKSLNIRTLALGRHCIQTVCNVYKPRSILLPTYTCASVRKVIEGLKIKIKYYSIARDFTPKIDSVKDDELLILNNYFGLAVYSENFKAFLNESVNSRCLIDNSQSIGMSNQFPNFLSFISPRKFLPVTDGGVLFDPKHEINDNSMPNQKDNSVSRVQWIFRAFEDGGRNKSYNRYLQYRNKLQNIKYKRMSDSTFFLLEHFDIKKVISRRYANFKKLLTEIPISNIFKNIKIDINFSPIGFPIHVSNSLKSKKRLSESKIYSIQYWPEFKNEKKGNIFERKLSNKHLFLSIDSFPSASQLIEIKKEIIS